MKLNPDIRDIARHFQLGGEPAHAEPFGNGHINDTFRLALSGPDSPPRFILQRLNRHVFNNPGAVMENIRRVSAHLAEKFRRQPDAARRVLTSVPAASHQPFWRDAAGNCWRMFHFIEHTRTVNVIESPAQAYQAAKAFGEFQKLLADLPPPRLHETIPNFHHTPGRFAALEKAVADAPAQRAAAAAAEIEFARRYKDICSALTSANLPERVTHNDTKINNVLFDEITGEGLCVIDLDTVMPGLAPCDFGDLVRSATNPAREDEPDLTRVEMSFPLFEALLRGYLSGAGDLLNADEKALLPVAGQVIAFELGLRFLADFLAGDVYFKVRHEGQNLDRCRVQFKMFASMQRQEPAMARLVETVCRAG
jgi:hypothetical protein